MKTTRQIINEWFAQLPKGYALPPYSMHELEVLRGVVKKHGINQIDVNALNEVLNTVAIDEASIMKGNVPKGGYKPGQMFVAKDGIAAVWKKLGVVPGVVIQQVTDLVPNTSKSNKGIHIVNDPNSVAQFIKTFKVVSPEDSPAFGKKIVVGTTDRSGYAGDWNKGFNTTSSVEGSRGEPTGADWESLLVLAYNSIGDQVDKTSQEWKQVGQYWPEYGAAANKIARHMERLLEATQLRQMGATRATLSPEWTGVNSTPKTDIIGEDADDRISLKKAGGSQLMSAGKDETVSTFQAAARMVSSRHPRKVKQLIDDIGEKMGRLAVIGSIDKFYDPIKRAPKPNAPKEVVKQIEQLLQNATQLTQDINLVFSKDSTFKQYFCFEAATGTNKFSDRIAVANQLLEFDAKRAAVSHYLPIHVPEDADPIAASTKFYVSFKSSGGSSGLTLRAQVKKLVNASYEYEGKLVEGIDGTSIKTFRQIVTEALLDEHDLFESGVLTESVDDLDMLNEWDWLAKIKSNLTNASSTVVDAAKRIYTKITTALEAAFEQIKKMGRLMFDKLMEFLGLEVEDVSVESSGPWDINWLLAK